MENIRSVAEYQLWGLSDWVAGSVGQNSASRHFHAKQWEEYIEAQDEINGLTEHIPSELADNLFCMMAFATQLRCNVSRGIHSVLNEVLPDYAKRTTKKPVRFSQIDDLVTRFPNLPVAIACLDSETSDFFRNIPTSYLRTYTCTQSELMHQVRIYRTLLSCAQARMNEAFLICEDDELDVDADDTTARLKYAEQKLVQAITLTLALSSHIALTSGSSLKTLVNANVNKISDRLARGLPVTKTKR
jgi:hypothetical protein